MCLSFIKYTFRSDSEEFVHEGFRHVLQITNVEGYNIKIQRAAERYIGLKTISTTKTVYKPIQPVVVNIGGCEYLAKVDCDYDYIVKGSKIGLEGCIYAVIGVQDGKKFLKDASFFESPYALPISLHDYFDAKGYWDPDKAVDMFLEILDENYVEQHKFIKEYDKVITGVEVIPDDRPMHTCKNAPPRSKNTNKPEYSFVTLIEEAYVLVYDYTTATSKDTDLRLLARAVNKLSKNICFNTLSINKCLHRMGLSELSKKYYWVCDGLEKMRNDKKIKALKRTAIFYDDFAMLILKMVEDALKKRIDKLIALPNQSRKIELAREVHHLRTLHTEYREEKARVEMIREVYHPALQEELIECGFDIMEDYGEYSSEIIRLVPRYPTVDVPEEDNQERFVGGPKLNFEGEIVENAVNFKKTIKNKIKESNGIGCKMKISSKSGQVECKKLGLERLLEETDGSYERESKKIKSNETRKKVLGRLFDKFVDKNFSQRYD